MRVSRERDIDTTIKGAPRRFSAAGVRLSGINSIPMVITHRVWPWPEDAIYLFGRDTEANRYGAQVFIHVYPLPEGSREFRRELASYRKQRRGFLVEGEKFEDSLLLPQSFSRRFQRESFQTRDGAYRRRIVHVFAAPERAVLLVYSLNAARFLSSTFFQHVSESLKI